MKKQLLCLIVPAIFYGDTLNELLDFANTNNSLIISKSLTTKAKQYEVDSSKSANMPTLDIGGFYQNLNEKTPNLSGDIYSAYAKISYDIYDGSKKSSIIKQKENELQSSSHDIVAFKKSLSLQIVQDFYNIQNTKSLILSLKEKRTSLKAQLQRVEKFYEANLSTKDDVDKLQSAYDTNSYNLESLKFQKLSLLQAMMLKVGKNISSLDHNSFIKNSNIKLELNDAIKSLKAKSNSLENVADSLNSVYLPKINISDTYSIYDYKRTDSTHLAGLDNQNKLMLNINLRLFDGGSVNKSKKAILINKKALNSQIDYKTQEQKMQFDLSISRIATSKLKIKSAFSALTSAKSAYSTIDEKYKAGIADNVAYLDALSVKTNATALYTKSLNNLEVAYAIYYFNAGKNIQDYIKMRK